MLASPDKVYMYVSTYVCMYVTLYHLSKLSKRPILDFVQYANMIPAPFPCLRICNTVINNMMLPYSLPRIFFLISKIILPLSVSCLTAIHQCWFKKPIMDESFASFYNFLLVISVIGPVSERFIVLPMFLSAFPSLDLE